MAGISFEDRVVIVTGGGGGIGRTYALDIARRGGSVVVNDLGGDIFGHDPSDAMSLRVTQEIVAAGGKAIANHEDIGSVEAASRLVDTAISTFGKIDAVINNAGIMRNALLQDTREEDIDATLSAHLRGTLNVTRAAWPHMKARKYGRVVFTSSSAGMYGNRLQAAYGAAKAGVTGLMNVLSHEGEPHGILCNGIMPNAAGRMGDQMLKDYQLDEVPQKRADALDVGNSFDPDFNSGLGVYLASAECTSTHALYSSCVGRYARVFIGVTPGWNAGRDVPPSAEDISEHFGEISDLTRGFELPISSHDEIGLVLKAAG
jgi:NAD(P)-dependent dehydrogenase (short-subunit alcohol dehydrogenase family)